MKLLRALPLIALHLAAPAAATDWWFVSADADTVVIADADSISGGTIRVAIKRVFPRPREGFAIVGSELEIDCRSRRERYLRVMAWSPELELISDGPPHESFRDWREPDANGVVMARFVCDGRSAPGATWVRIGTLSDRPGDRALLFRLIEEGVPQALAVPLALGALPRRRAQEMIAAAPPEIAAILRRNGFPR